MRDDRIKKKQGRPSPQQGYIFSQKMIIPPPHHLFKMIFFSPSSYCTDWGKIYLFLKYQILSYSSPFWFFLSLSPLFIFSLLFFLLFLPFHHNFPKNFKILFPPAPPWGFKWKIYIPAPQCTVFFEEYQFTSKILRHNSPSTSRQCLKRCRPENQNDEACR